MGSVHAGAWKAKRLTKKAACDVMIIPIDARDGKIFLDVYLTDCIVEKVL